MFLCIACDFVWGTAAESTEIVPLCGQPLARNQIVQVKTCTMRPAFARFAGRFGTHSLRHATLVEQNGIEAVLRWSETSRLQTVMLLGGAASQPLCTPLRQQVLRRPLQYMLENGRPITCHTSQATLPALDTFLETLGPTLPWDSRKAWSASLQLDGTSAVHAACGMLQQRRQGCVAVASSSYHGAVPSGYGSRARPRNQIIYPAVRCDSTEAQFYAWLEAHASKTSVLLVEPHGGSAVVARPWSADRLQRCAAEARRRGIAVCCDEVMCGMSRHGRGTVFLTRAWNIDVDAVVFGKGISDGSMPLAGAAVRMESGPVAESHTYSGASGPSLVCASEMLNVVPSLQPHIQRVEQTIRRSMDTLPALCDELRVHGQGLLWGIECGNPDLLTDACLKHGVMLYQVAGGALVTPPLDVPLHQLDNALQRLQRAVAVYSRRV